ncbi:D-beta-hydroxybutyrate dehydrogenase, mitochondrial [Macrotis lagotis]|uniref:D-beta-hydroxybutyrate dehydrogenase, mitochondrial n=1 Tax=Macrotis lagotis TaxID=92651 RepID=UPI003D686E26
MLVAQIYRALAHLVKNASSSQTIQNIIRPSQALFSPHYTGAGQKPCVDKGRQFGNNAVFVTGCDTGFGLSIAKHLHSQGFMVFAGCLHKREAGAKELDALNCNRMKTVQLNVCDNTEVDRAIEFIQENLKEPQRGIWGLVNNAGISTFGEVEFTSLETYKEVAEVNLWGMIRITKASLPLLRRAKGRIINISSMLGRMASAAHSTYCITKFGMEAFSDCLRYEMYPLDVKVSVVEPSNFIAATKKYSPQRIQDIADKMWNNLPEVVREDYGRQYFDEKIRYMETYYNNSTVDSTPVVEAVNHALTAKIPYTRYHPMDCYWWMHLQTYTPEVFSDMIYSP